MSVNETAIGSDEETLHRLGYAQELLRRMSGFSNFAVSFTIISILSGCLTVLGPTFILASFKIRTQSWAQRVDRDIEWRGIPTKRNLRTWIEAETVVIGRGIVRVCGDAKDCRIRARAWSWTDRRACGHSIVKAVVAVRDLAWPAGGRWYPPPPPYRAISD